LRNPQRREFTIDIAAHREPPQWTASGGATRKTCRATAEVQRALGAIPLQLVAADRERESEPIKNVGQRGRIDAPKERTPARVWLEGKAV
jgi:hypothetical protein